MHDEEYKNKDEEGQGLDPFTQFMFGPNSRRRMHSTEEMAEEKTAEGEEDESSSHHSDDLISGGKSSRRPDENDDWLFGRGRNRNSPEHDGWLFGGGTRDQHEDDDSLSRKVNNILNNINYEELMNNIDTLMTSASQLKPLLKKARPLIDQFLKK